MKKVLFLILLAATIGCAQVPLTTRSLRFTGTTAPTTARTLTMVGDTLFITMADATVYKFLIRDPLTGQGLIWSSGVWQPGDVTLAESTYVAIAFEDSMLFMFRASDTSLVPIMHARNLVDTAWTGFSWFPTKSQLLLYGGSGGGSISAIQDTSANAALTITSPTGPITYIKVATGGIRTVHFNATAKAPLAGIADSAIVSRYSQRHIDSIATHRINITTLFSRYQSLLDSINIHRIVINSLGGTGLTEGSVTSYHIQDSTIEAIDVNPAWLIEANPVTGRYMLALNETTYVFAKYGDDTLDVIFNDVVFWDDTTAILNYVKWLAVRAESLQGYVPTTSLHLADNTYAGIVPSGFGNPNMILGTDANGNYELREEAAGTGGGSANVLGGEDAFATTATRDSVYNADINSYDQVFIAPIPSDSMDLPTPGEYMQAYVMPNYFIALREDGDTSAQPYRWICNTGTFSAPTGVGADFLGGTTNNVRVHWTPNGHRLLGGHWVLYSDTNYCQTYAAAPNKVFSPQGDDDDTLTCTVDTLYVTVLPTTIYGEYGEISDGDTVGITEEAGSPDPVFADSISGLAVEYKGYFAENAVESNGDTVSIIYDSKNAYDAVPAFIALNDTSKLPRYRTGIGVNARAGWQLSRHREEVPDGAAAYDTISRSIRCDDVATLVDGDDQPFTIVMVGRLDTVGMSTGGLGAAFCFNQPGALDQYHEGQLYPNNIVRQLRPAATQHGVTLTAARDTMTVLSVMTWVFDGTQSTMYWDGNNLGTAGLDAASRSFTQFIIGNEITNAYWHRWTPMTMTHFLLYTKALSTDELTWLLAKLKYYYGTH